MGHRLGGPSCPSLRSPSAPQGKPGRLSGLAGVRTGCSHRLCSPGGASLEAQTWGSCPAPLPRAAQCPASASEPSFPLCLRRSPARPGLIQIRGSLIKVVPFLPGGESNWESRPVPPPSRAPCGRLGVSPQPLTPQAGPAPPGGKREPRGLAWPETGGSGATADTEGSRAARGDGGLCTGSPAHPGGPKAHRGLPLCSSRKVAPSVSFQREEVPGLWPSLQSRVVRRGCLLTPSLPAPIG